MISLLESKPLVTVYIPTYNRSKLLRRAVESVLQQTYENLEIIIVDDCSTDETHSYLEKLAAEDSRIRYFLKENNSGACVSRNIAIKKAQGEFITGLDDDDFFEKERIEFFLRAADKNRNEAYFSNIKIQISNDNIILPSRIDIATPRRIKKCKKLLKKNFIGNQIFIKTEILSSSNGFDENLKAWQDLECWFNLIKTRKVVFNFLSEATQVIDVSHEHERITRKNLKNVVDAYQYFVEKHNLDRFESLVLKGQLYGYMPDKFNFLQKILLFAATKRPLYLKRLF